MEPPRRLTSLGPDILLPILEELQDKSPATFREFRLASRYCNELVESILYKVIVWRQWPMRKKSYTKWLVQRLLDDKDRLSRYVHEIRVESFKPSSNSLNQVTLELVLAHVDELRTLSWDATAFIPPSTLDCFETFWPSARLNVQNHDRLKLGVDGFESIDNRLDHRLLSSTKLYSLDLVVFIDERNFKTVSEFPKLTRLLLKSRNLRKLRLDIARPVTQRRRSIFETPAMDGAGPVNLNFKDGDVFPPLEELEICSREYEMSIQHCRNWLDCMDWSNMRRLSLPETCPQDLLEGLTGAMPRLKSFRYRVGRSPTYQLGRVVKRFIDAAKGLEYIDVLYGDVDYFDFIWPSILKHARTLRKVAFSWVGEWSLKALQDLLAQCSRLQELEISIDGEIKTNDSSNPSMMEKAAYIISVIQSSPKSRHLRKLFFYSQIDRTLETNKYPISYRGKTAQKSGWVYTTASKEKKDVESPFFKSFFVQNPCSELVYVEIRYQFANPISVETFTDSGIIKIRRRDRSGSNPGDCSVEHIS